MRNNNSISKNANIMKRIKKYKTIYILFIPVVIFYIIFDYLPISGMVMAFKDFNFVKGIWDSDWVGFKHFERFLTNGDFWKVVSNTFIINGIRLIFVFPIPIIFAILLNEVKSVKFKRTLQTISYMPHFLSWVIVAGLMYTFLSPSIGFINQILKELGCESVLFMGSEKWFRPIVVISHAWKETGWTAIVFIAALTGIDINLYEAAVIDGANRWHRIWSISIPCIAPIISIMFILWTGQIMRMGFEQIVVLINDPVMNVGETIDYYVYRTGITQVNNYSYATAVGFFQGIIGMILIVGSNKIAKSIDPDGGVW